MSKSQKSVHPTVGSGSPGLFDKLDSEMWLVRRLAEHGAKIFDGVTDSAERLKRMRAAIREHGLESVIVGRGKDGKPATYSEAFQRLYGQKL